MSEAIQTEEQDARRHLTAEQRLFKTRSEEGDSSQSQGRNGEVSSMIGSSWKRLRSMPLMEFAGQRGMNVGGLLSAITKIEHGHKVMKTLRNEVAHVVINLVLGAHERRTQSKSSSRVIGSLLMEAYEWDKDVLVPRDLPRMYLKMVQEFASAAYKRNIG